MKKFIVLAVLAAVFVSGCKKEFLDPKFYAGGGTAEAFLVNEPSLDKLTQMVYKRLISGGDFVAKGLYGSLMWNFADGGADLVNSRNQQWDKDPIAIQVGTQSPSTGLLSDLWRQNYEAIRFANDVIDNAGKVSDDKFTIMKRENYVGEARFVRALAYFNLVRIFGGRPHVASEDVWGVPLITKAVTSPEGLLLPRNKVSEVYAQIISDLEQAEQGLPTSWPSSLFGFQTKGRIVKGSAWGLLAKVYMTKAGTSTSATADWTNAAKWADKVLDPSSGFSLKTTGAGPFANNPYYSLFRIDGNGENSEESLFEVQSINDSPGLYGFGDSYNNFLASNAAMAGNHKGNAHPTQTFVNMYEANDQRREASIFVPGDRFYPDKGNGPLRVGNADYIYRGLQTPLPSGQRSTSTGYNVKKFISGIAIYNRHETGPANPRVLRYAEMLLIKAEAVNFLTGPAAAYPFVNRVRARAGLGDLPAGLSPTDMKLAIWKERALELFMEADRWFDLKRTDRLISLMKAQNDAFPTPNSDNKFNTDKHYIQPIPQSEINATIVNGSPLLIQAPEY